MRTGSWTPYASLVFSHDAEADGRQVKVSTSLSPTPVQFDAATAADSYATANLGVVGQLGEQLQLGLDIASVVGNDDLKDTRMSATIRMPF